MHVSGLGAGWTWLVSEDSNLPIFTHHANDVVEGKLKRREYITQSGRVGDVINSRRFQVLWP